MKKDSRELAVIWEEERRLKVNKKHKENKKKEK